MIRADFHVHTSFCDGKNTPEEMVLAAIKKGMDAIGFSGHSHLAFDDSWSMSLSGTEAYRAEVHRLKEKYAGQIRIFCGVEQDIYSDAEPEGYEYVIGAVHCVLRDGEYLSVDDTPEVLDKAVREHYSGDYFAFAEDYYRTVSRVCTITKCDVIAHFDLVTKFNEGGRRFDESHPRYVAAWQAAADALLAYGKPFEINTGAMARGYRSVPYPSAPIQRYLTERGASFVLSGDAHSTEGLCFGFDALADTKNLIVPVWQQT